MTTDVIKLYFDDNNVAHAYDDEFDLTIHCESAEELEHVKELLKNAPHWIPVSEGLPEISTLHISGRDIKKSKPVLVTVESDEKVGDRGVEKGRIWDGKWKTDIVLSKTHVVAWMPFPEPYEGKE